jgi:hypothetical protein
MAYGYKFFFEMLKHTEASQLHDATYLFQHHDRSLFWDQGSPDVELDSTGVERVFRFRTSKNAVLMLRSSDLKTVWYPLKRFLLKGDRVRFLHRQGSYERAYEAPIAMFDKGVTLTKDLTLLENHEAEGEHEIVIQGFLSDLHPYDFSYDVSALNENFDLKVETFLLKPKH